MQPAARQQALERAFNARKGHVPHISISDDSHHVTEAIGSYYGSPTDDTMAGAKRDPRPLSFVSSPSEVFDAKSRRHGSYFDMKRTSPPRTPLGKAGSSTENDGGDAQASPPPPLSRQATSEIAVQQFPLNDIDYESSPAAVAQELSNLQAIRRMSMNVDTADPDLPSFSGAFGNVPTVAPGHGTDDDDPSKLFWVPAHLHPELAPKEFRTFAEERMEKIRRRSDGADNLSPDSMDWSGSSASSLRRKKSMLSHQIDTKGNYEDGAERLERKRSSGMQVDGHANVANLSELEELVNDPSQLMGRMSLETSRKSHDSGIEVSPSEDVPILPPVGQSLKRSTRTTYRRGSLRKGERVPFSKRAQARKADSSEADESPVQSSVVPPTDDREPILGLTRVQTEPTPPPSEPCEVGPRTSSRRQRPGLGSSQSSDGLTGQDRSSAVPPPAEEERQQRSPSVCQSHQQYQQQAPQPKQFHSRLASHGRTTAQLPGYVNPNPLPHIIETLPDGTKVPVGNLAQQLPERKSSHELPRPYQRGGAHMRHAPGSEAHTRSSTLDDISSHPSPLPGSGNTRTDALTMVPTFEDKKVDKKDGTRKSSWKWILGNDDDEKEKKAKEEKAVDAASLKASKLKKAPDKARLDVLQNSIDGTVPARGRESIVLNREDVKLEEERKKEGKRSSDSARKEKDKEPGLLSTIFGGKKKSSDGDLKDRKRKEDRRLSPEPPPRILKPDIDYNWTRFSILEERAIYRMAHIKLANPRRPLYSQVLLSNFMYSYLAKVQMMHPQIQIPAAQKAAQQRGQKKEEQPVEYSQYQRWHEQQERQNGSQSPANNGLPARSNSEYALSSGAEQTSYGDQRPSFDMIDQPGYDQRSSEEHNEWPDYREPYKQQPQYNQQPQRTDSREAAVSKANGMGYHGEPPGRQRGGAGRDGEGRGYSVASTHDYLGYPKDQQPFGGAQDSLWHDEKAEELW